MADVLKSLDDITTGFNIFERNQVLSHDQLNTLGSYLDDQGRLTRVGEIGVGVCCGLWPSLVEFKVSVTKGVGVTTDGDVIRFGADTVYDRFKPYDDAAPVYAPFMAGATRIPLFELVADKVKDQQAMPLNAFAGRTGFALETMVAVLYMESFVRDPDLCTGADCDNLGKDAVNTPRVLLTDRRSATQLLSPFDTPDLAARDLDAVVAARPILVPASDTPVTVSAIYLGACTATLGPLSTALGKIFPRCRAFLGGVFTEDPAPVWTRILNGLQSQFTASSRGIQYYYDFLTDLVETYTAFRSLMFGDTAICAPDFGGFPKHMLLGRLGRENSGTTFRTPFYPSPGIAASTDRRKRMRFLARKLDAMIFSFELPSSPIVVRVTPSNSEDRDLEVRAIPHYYRVNESRPIHRHWNYRLEQSGMSAFNYSYNAASYGALGGAASPLTSSIASFTSFRVEGQLGRSVGDALALINRDIVQFNLPITARAVMLDPDRTKLPWRPPFRFTDLHRLHYLFRNDVVTQLEEVSKFGDTFKGNLDLAINDKKVLDDSPGSEAAGVGSQAASTNTALKARAALGMAKLARPFEAHVSDASWKADVADTMETAGQFKVALAKVAKTEFATPFDSLISNRHIHLLPWIEDLIKHQDEKEQTKVLFGPFLTEHRGLEHRASVPAGGTLVLAHDTNGTVLFDFVLPYFAPAPVEEREEEPPLLRPIDIRPPIFFNKAVSLLPSRDRFVKEELAKFRVDLQPDITKAIDVQGRYLDGLKDSMTLFGNAISGTTVKPGVVQIPGVKVQDPTLDSKLKDTRAKVGTLEFIKGELLDPANADRRQVLEKQLKDAETEVADSINTTTTYIAKNTVDVSAGSDGLAAMIVVSDALGRINTPTVLTTVKTGLETARTSAKPDLQNVIGGVLRQKGLGQ